MRKLIPLLSLTAVFLSGQLFLNCSSPLESINDGQPTPPPPPDTTFIFDTVTETDTVALDTVALDTVVQKDTVVLHDTVTQTDTVTQIDTVTQTDTITIVDTIIIIEPDTTGTNRFCGNLSAHQQQIVWLFKNNSGNYRLEFVASTEQDKPPKDLEIDIDGQVFMWSPTQNMELTLEHELIKDATIKIISTSPHSRGHTVTVCLTARPISP